jgi:hypothetical protein
MENVNDDSINNYWLASDAITCKVSRYLNFLVKVVNFMGNYSGAQVATSFKQSLMLEASKRAVHCKVRDVLNAVLKKEIYKAYKMPLVVSLNTIK